MERRPKNISISRSLIIILVTCAFALGIFIGRGSWLFGTGESRVDGPFQFSSEDFRYIRQSLQQESTPEGKKKRELKPFRYKVNALIEQKVAEESASSISVYFRDLDNGNRFGIREQDLFSPENQLKLPLLIAYFKWAEATPLVLRKKLTFTAPERSKYRFLTPPSTIQQGTAYSVNDLLFRMIAYGDNDAYSLLAANLPPKRLQTINKDLYVNYDPSKKEDFLSLSSYASFFRVLFNASYLSEEMSEKALRYLTRSSFKKGMASAVPPEIEVANKAGERTIGSASGQEIMQLHEFGIIYHPRRPFLLGITARGADYDQLVTVIRDITRLIYEEVETQTGEEL
ncbi:MAG: class A beta-lactamase-related serine hydrolase [Nitrospirota bacterium]|nr:class A beta-lactamase-related serine hydrolase [Nitrospirota bacterium]